MADRPSFQFYPAEWRNNAKLQRCSIEARGAWMDVLCLLHDADEYGVLRWPLEDIAQAVRLPIKLLRELSTKGVLKGSDAFAEGYSYAPFHAGKYGEARVLVMADGGPCWFCSRFVKDEWKRHQRGKATQFSESNQPPKPVPNPTPKGGIGERQGDGSSSASSSSTSNIKSKAKAKSPEPSARFTEFWALYPKSAAKQDAIKAWNKGGLDAEADRILTALSAQLAGGMWQEIQFVPNGATYLNGRRWEDPVISRAHRPPLSAPPGKTMQALQALEGIKHELADTRTGNGVSEAFLLESGAHSRR